MPLSSAIAPCCAALALTTAAQQAAEAPALFRPELRVIHELDGEGPGDQFGWIGRNAGDCDGDGIADVFLSAPTRSDGGTATGKVYLYSGKSGALLFARVGGAPGDQLGLGIERAGDVDGDGRSDVIAGAPGHDRGRGQALVLSGRDGKVLLTLEGEAAGDSFGRKVASAGDVDGDGHADVLVGAEYCDSTATDAGRAYLFSGKDGSAMLALDGEEQGDRFGVACAGWSRGAENLLVIGAGDAGPGDMGRAYVFSLVDGEAELRSTIESDPQGVGLGRMFVSVVGDVDADGFPDVYASDFEHAGLGTMTGRIYVHSGKTGERLLTLSGTTAGEGFGIGTADVGDVNGDGHADLLLGAWQNAEGAPSAGKCTLHSGRDGSVLGAWVCTLAQETFGFDTTGMGDVDGDGALDFLITNAWSGVRGARSGRAFVLAGPSFPREPAPAR